MLVKTVLMVACVFIGALLIMATSVMWLVNYLFSRSFLLHVFGIEQLDFSRALALMILCVIIIFKGTSSVRTK